MLCIAGPQAAVVFALLALAGRHHLASHRAGNIGMVQVGPDGYYRLFRKACSPQAGDIRILQQYWQGPGGLPWYCAIPIFLIHVPIS